MITIALDETRDFFYAVCDQEGWAGKAWDTPASAIAEGRAHDALEHS